MLTAKEWLLSSKKAMGLSLPITKIRNRKALDVTL